MPLRVSPSPAGRLLPAALAALLGFSAPVVRAQQLLRIDPAEIDFGRHAENQTATLQARLTNNSQSPVTLTGVEADCGCLHGEMADLKLGPGESTALTVRMESGGAEGEFQHSLVVNSTTGPAITIPVRMSVYHYASWSLSPPRIILPPSRRGREAAGELRLEYRGIDRPRVASIVSDSPWIKIAPGTVSGNSLVYQVTKLPGAPGGAVYADIRIAAGAPGTEPIDVPVFAYVTSGAAIDPNPVIMPVAKSGEPSTTEVRIKNWDGLEPPRPDLPGGQARLAGGKGRDLILQLTLTSQAPGSTTHTLSLYDGNQAVLAVPVIERTTP